MTGGEATTTTDADCDCEHEFDEERTSRSRIDCGCAGEGRRVRCALGQYAGKALLSGVLFRGDWGRVRHVGVVS